MSAALGQKSRTRRAAVRELVNAVRSRSAVLFVGAGVSMNLGVPSWLQLTAHIAERLGFDPDELRDAELEAVAASKGPPDQSSRLVTDFFDHRDIRPRGGYPGEVGRLGVWGAVGRGGFGGWW
jgi:hypothetical protein